MSKPTRGPFRRQRERVRSPPLARYLDFLRSFIGENDLAYVTEKRKKFRKETCGEIKCGVEQKE